jgi:putative ABC transport system substrate-binding protein
MNRRRGIVELLAGALLAASTGAAAQQGDRLVRLAILMGVSQEDAAVRSWHATLTDALQQLGWVEGRNLHVETRWSAGDAARARDYAVELVGWAPQLAVGHSLSSVRALRQASASLPIVFVNVADPVGQGFAASLSQPGANVTGFANFDDSMAGKWLQTLKEIAPSVARVLIIFNPQTFPTVWRPMIEKAAPGFGLVPVFQEVRAPAELAGVIQSFAGRPGGGLLFVADAFIQANIAAFIALAAEARLPAIYPRGSDAVLGGLAGYGIDNLEQFRRAAAYVDRILKGEAAGALPIQYPTKFELVINLKTARTLGLAIPPALLARADEVIE